MKNINKILLSVSFVAIAAVVFFIGQDRNMANIVISSNVEALSQTEGDDVDVSWGEEKFWKFWDTSYFEGYLASNNIMGRPVCSEWGKINIWESIGICYELVVTPKNN